MSKKMKSDRQMAIEQFIATKGVTRLEPGVNTEFLAYEAERKRRSFMTRKLGSPKASKSLWFVRGAGCI